MKDKGEEPSNDEDHASRSPKAGGANLSRKEDNVSRKKKTMTEPYALSVPRFGRLRRWQRVALALFVTLIALLMGLL